MSVRFIEIMSNNSYLLIVLPCLIPMCVDVQSNPGPDNSRHVLRHISIVNLNVNSLRNRTDLIFNELGDHDIICITETRLNNSICSFNLCLDNFLNPNDFRKDRQTDHRGGILIYVRNNMIAKRRLDLESNDIESICVEITSNNNKKFLVVCIYRPSNSRAISWSHIESLLDNCGNTELDLIFLDDINLDLLNCPDNHYFLLTTLKYGLHNVIHEPIRITPTSSTLLDPIFVSNIKIVRNSAVMPDFCSDHCYSILEINFRSLRENSYTKTILDYNNADYESIKTHLDLIKWHERLDNLNDTNVINNFINTFPPHLRFLRIPLSPLPTHSTHSVT
jgi:hypothetical protein